MSLMDKYIYVTLMTAPGNINQNSPVDNLHVWYIVEDVIRLIEGHDILL